MVRQGLRSLLNGRANLLHFPPHPRKAGKPKGQRAERPKGRKAERPKGENPGNLGAEKPRSRIGLGQADTKCRVRLPAHNRYATSPRGMPRHRAPRGGKNISCSLFIIFQSKLRVCLTHPPSHSNGHMLERDTILMPTLWNPGT